MAAFAAWRDEHFSVGQEEKTIADLTKRLDDLTKPGLYIFTPESAFGYNSKNDKTCIWLVVGVTNRGAPSVAGDWKLEIQSPRISAIVGYIEVPPLRFKNLGVEADFKNEDSIYEKIIQRPLEKGAAASGWAYFEIPGRTAFDEINKGEAAMRLICLDYLNNWHFSPTFWPAKEAARPDYFPGVKGLRSTRPQQAHQ